MILIQLPDEVKQEIYELFMFNKGFLSKYQLTLEIPYVIPIKRKNLLLHR